MTHEILHKKIDMLPEIMLSEANTFIDFLINKSKKSYKIKIRKPGFFKDKISITDDFDEPLDDFKDYKLL